VPLFRRRRAPRRSVVDPTGASYEPVADPDAPRWVVVGLGNPGERYAGTRHNVGAMVVEEMAGDRGAVPLKRHKSGCLIGEASEPAARLVFTRPTTYMNESGRPVRALLDFYKVDPWHLIVVHDEIDIPFGEVRLKNGGGLAGHNGLRSIAQHLGTQDFIRVRVGVSRPAGRKEAAGHVLNDFSRAERDRLTEVVTDAIDAIDAVVSTGIERAMNHVNTRS